MGRRFVRNGLAVVLSAALITGLNPAAALAYDGSAGEMVQQAGALSAANLTADSALGAQEVKYFEDFNVDVSLDWYWTNYQAGVVQKPKVFVSYNIDSDNGETIDPEYYTVTFVNENDDECDPMEIGSYRVVITGKNGWSGTISRGFSIYDPTDIGSIWYLNLNSSSVGYVAGELVYPNFYVVKKDGGDLVDGSLYTYKVMKGDYNDDTGDYEYVEVAAGEQKAGDYYLRIEPTVESGYHGYLESGFSVEDRFDIERLSKDLPKGCRDDWGDARFPVGELPDGFGLLVYEYGHRSWEDDAETYTLVKDVDYTVSYEKRIIDEKTYDEEWVNVDAFTGDEPGYYRFVATGIGNYHGVGYGGYFELYNPYDMEGLEVEIPTQWYSTYGGFFAGDAIPAEFVPKVYEYGYYNESHLLVKDTDYTVSYQEISSRNDAGEDVWSDVDAFDGTVVGTYRFKVTGIGKYSGTNYSDSFEIINPNDLRFAEIATQTKAVVQKGESYTPELTVTLKDRTLKEGTDYEVTYFKTHLWDNRDDLTAGEDDYKSGTETTLPLAPGADGVPGYYYAVVKGINDYSGSSESRLIRVSEVSSLRSATLKLNRTIYAYTGEPVVLDYELTAYDGTPLVEGKDYELVYGNWEYWTGFVGTSTGSAPVDIAPYDEYDDNPLFPAVYARGKGEYNGNTLVRTFRIVRPNDIRAAKLQFADPSIADSQRIAYTGQNVAPQFSVVMPAKDGDIALVEGKDYTASYWHTVTVVEDDGNSYNRDEQVDFPMEIGWYWLSIVGIFDDEARTGYRNSTRFYFGVCKPLTGVQVVAADQDYTGQALTPAVTVTLDGEVLPADQYEVEYANNVEVGVATVTVTPAPNSLYMGSATGSFKINKSSAPDPEPTPTPTPGPEPTPTPGPEPTPAPAPASLGNAVITGLKEATYTGNAIVQDKLVVTLGKTALVAGADYDVAYADNVNAGTATVTVTGKGNYTGTASAKFTIKPASIAGAALGLSAAKFTYTGKAQKPEVKTIGGKALVEGTDYTVAYSKASSKAAGKYTVTATGKGNYAGTSAAAGYTIAKAKNTLKATAKAKSVKLAKVKKKAQVVKGAIAVSKAQGKVTYAKVAKGSSKYLTINKTTGKITVKKGAKKGVQKIKVKVTAKGNANYLKGSKTVTVKVTVKK